MIEADRVLSTPPTSTPIDTPRRRFLTVAALKHRQRQRPGLGRHATPDSAADPIFAAIDAHRKANAAHWAAIKASEGLMDWSSITEKPCHDENDAFDCLIRVAASTLPGLSAKVAYLREIAENEAWMLDDREGTAIQLIESFAASLSAILRQKAVRS